MDENGRRGRAITRQVAQMETENALRDWAEEQLSEPLPPEIGEAVQAQYDQHIGKQMAQAEAEARRRDQAAEAAQEFIDEQTKKVNEL